MYYALTDTFAGDNPHDFNHGFANTKEPLAFRTRAPRDAWVNSTKLLTAESITRADALKLSGWVCGDYYGIKNSTVKVVRVYGEVDDYGLPVHHVIAEK